MWTSETRTRTSQMLSTSQSVILDWVYIEDSQSFSTVSSGPKPLPVPTHSHSLTTPGLHYGGLPLPKPRAVPKSLQLSIRVESPFVDSDLDRSTIGASTLAVAPDRKKLRMSVPMEHSKKAATDDLLRIKQPSQCTVIQKLWDELVCSLQHSFRTLSTPFIEPIMLLAFWRTSQLQPWQNTFLLSHILWMLVTVCIFR